MEVLYSPKGTHHNNTEQKIEKYLVNEKDRMYGDGITYGKITVDFSIEDTGDRFSPDKYSIADKFAAKIERLKVKHIYDISVNSVDV